jgi:hypothetical protein
MRNAMPESFIEYEASGESAAQAAGFLLLSC